MSDTTPRAAGAGVSEYRTPGQFSVLAGPSGEPQLWCNPCMTPADLTETDPDAVTAEAELLKREHDDATCAANKGKPLHARQWTRDGGTSPLDTTAGAG